MYLPVYQGEKFKKYLQAAKISAQTAADILKVSRQTVYQYFASSNLERETVSKILTAFNVSEEEIFKLSEKEIAKHRIAREMKAELEAQNKTKVAEPLVPYGNVIPMYDGATTASGVEVYNDMVQAEPAFMVSIPQFRDCSFGKVVYGRSMEPTIENGTYIFCKPVADKFFFMPGEIYYIEVDNFAMCKRLQLGNEPGYALAESDNEETRPDGQRKYQTVPIELDKVRKMYLVKGYFRQSQN